MLLAHEDLPELRGRWDDLQAAFVDDPKECVQKADALVAEVVEQLTTRFLRSAVATRGAVGSRRGAFHGGPSLALKRYREFFQRLLSV